MTTTIGGAGTATTMSTRVMSGALGGLAGGLVFGMMMQAMGMIGMVAMLAGSRSTALGWLLHLAISAVIGAGFSLLLARYATSTVAGTVAGAGYGMVWWVLGPLLLMPARLGMPLFRFDDVAAKSLMGHVIFGMILGAVVVAVGRRSAARA